MCGRFVRSFTIEELVEEINEVVPTVSVVSRGDAKFFDANFNVAPTTMIPVVRFTESEFIVDVMQWGFQAPKSASRTNPTMPPLVINARSETVVDKPMFRGLLAGHRCVVPMDGFYEWKRDDSTRGKVPFYVSRNDKHRMWVAGLWRGQLRDDSLGQSAHVALLTAEANDDIAYIHDRTPCQLTLEDALHWASDVDVPLQLVERTNHPRLHAWHVSKDVNYIRNNRPDLVTAIERNLDSEQLGLFE